MIRRCAPAVAVGLAVVTVSAVLPGQESRRSTPPGTTKATAPKAEKVETAPKGAARVEVRDGAPVFDPLIVDLTHQYSQQLRPYLRAEMHRLRAVSRPTPEQFPTLDRDAERALVVAARAAAEAQRQRAWEKGQPITSLPEANQLVAEKLLEAAKDHLTPEQVARYRAEVERRIRERRSAAVRDLVASLDVRMALSADQREKLVASLIEHWDDSWGRDLERLGLPNDLGVTTG